MVVYITTQNSRIIRVGRHLLVTKDGNIHNTLFPYKLEQLVLLGNVQLTSQATKLLLQENIDTVFMRLDGRYQGRLAAAEHKNVFLRKKQFLLTDDEEFCLRAAKGFVYGKLANMATVAQRISRTRGNQHAASLSSKIRDTARNLDKAHNLQTLRGFEGSATAQYFQAFRYGLDHDLGFTKRVRRPPTDPVNSVLSLIYTFLINRCYAAVRLAGLDPYPGAFHSLDYGRFSLPLDLVEEFRPTIADTLVLSLFNLRILQEKDFYRPEADIVEEETEDNIVDPIASALKDPLGRMSLIEDESSQFDLPEQKMEDNLTEEPHPDKARLAVKVWPDAFKRILQAFERKMSTDFYHPAAEQKMTYSEALIYQAKCYRRMLEGEASEYRPLLLK